MKTKTYIILIIIFMTLAGGCASNKIEPEIIPPEQLQDLLHKENVNLAYKSATKKDYEAEDDC